MNDFEIDYIIVEQKLGKTKIKVKIKKVKS